MPHTVENEYAGRESEIRSFLLEYIKKRDPHFRVWNIVVQSIGKGAPTHHLGWAARVGKQKVDRSISEEELLAVVE